MHTAEITFFEMKKMKITHFHFHVGKQMLFCEAKRFESDLRANHYIVYLSIAFHLHFHLRLSRIMNTSYTGSSSMMCVCHRSARFSEKAHLEIYNVNSAGFITFLVPKMVCTQFEW